MDGYLYAVAALVVAMLVFLVFEILQRDGVFGILISCLENQVIQELVVGLIAVIQFILHACYNAYYIYSSWTRCWNIFSRVCKTRALLNFVRLCIETMASLPSIVVGLFGLLVFVTMTGWGYTVMGGALALTILNLPGLTRVCENAISEVPHNVKEASLGLGATKWQTIVRIIIPSSLLQIITGIILAAGRIFGEAAALIYTAGLTSPILNSAADFSSPAHPLNPFRPAETLAVHIWKLNSEGFIPDAKLIATKSAAVLIIMVLLFNVISRLIASVLHKRFTGTKRKSKTTKKIKAA